MGDKSKIEWTDATWNPIRGCSVVSEGCRNCYAMNFAARFSGRDKIGDVLPYNGLAYRNESGAHWTGQVRLIEGHLKDPLRWKEPRRIFVNSMSDLFHESVPDEWIDHIFAVMALSPQHTFQILTKRPQRMLAYMRALTGDRVLKTAFESGLLTPNIQYVEAYAGVINGDGWPLPNVWLGVSVEDQKSANDRIPPLLQTPAAVRWVSAEPLLAPININRWLGCADPDHRHSGSCALYGADHRIRWVVVGGESGTNARPMHPNWARSIRDQCVGTEVSFFFKQWGKYLPVGRVKDGDELVPGTAVFNQDGERLLPDCCGGDYDVEPGDVAIRFAPAGRKGHRLLDGQMWDQYPAVALGEA